MTFDWFKFEVFVARTVKSLIKTLDGLVNSNKRFGKMLCLHLHKYI
jgi:hypothetical protein